MKPTEKQLELIRRCLDGESTEEEFAQLEDLIRSDADFRKDYLRYLNVDSALAVLPKETNGATDDVGREALQNRQTARQIFRADNAGRFRSTSMMGWIAATATLLMFAVLGYWAIQDTNDQSNDPSSNLLADRDVDDTGVAVLTRVAGLQGTATTQWRVGQTISPGSMAWDAGLLQLEFYGGASIVVEGPAEIELVDESRVVCRAGKIRAHVPEPARGFAVLTPSFELVDLGTEFGLSVEGDGKAEVHVFDGKVELYDAESNRSLTSRRELNAGDAITLDRDGTSKHSAAQETNFRNVESTEHDVGCSATTAVSRLGRFPRLTRK